METGITHPDCPASEGRDGPHVRREGSPGRGVTTRRRSVRAGGVRNRFHRLAGLAVAPLALLATLTAATPASATSVSTVMVGVHPPTPGATASYPISFIPATTLGDNSTITVQAAPGTTFSACPSTCSDYTIAQGGLLKKYAAVSVGNAGGSTTANTFVVTVGSTDINAGKSVTILAQGTNPTGSGTGTLTISTSKNLTPVSVNYTIGTASAGLLQGAVPNGAASPMLALSSPTYLQSMFGAPTSTEPSLATAYISSNNWAQIDGSGGSLAFLQTQGWSTPDNQPIPGYQLVIGVPILPSKNGSVSLQNGASGTYNGYFRQLATSLIGEGLGNSWLRLGYEFDNSGLKGPSSPWGTGNSITQEGYFAQFWRQIVTTMRAVTGANFKFVWNPDGYAFLGQNDQQYLKSGGFSPAAAWPGSQYVDFVGADVYDWQPTMETGYTQAENWANFIEPQLQGAEQFASSEGVPLAFPEWGVMSKGPVFPGMGDDPSYVNGMYCFMVNRANNVAWESYSNTSYQDWNTQITGSSFPQSLAAFRSDFGQGSASACNPG